MTALSALVVAHNEEVQLAGRLDCYSTMRARDLRDSGGLLNNVRRLFSRFIKCYVMRRGYREGGYGFLIALIGGLYPLLSYLKARYEVD